MVSSSLQRTNTIASETDFEGTASTPTLTRQNTGTSGSFTPPPSTPGDNEQQEVGSNPAAKKFKITANNGREVQQKLASLEKRRVKRARSSVLLEQGDVNEAGGSKRASKRAPARGKLALLPSLPMDILFETFSHLCPVDIVNLSRTSKSLRRMLLNRNATSLWKQVFAHPEVEDHPACPGDLSLPKWASLLFDTHCHNCLTAKVRNIEWNLRVRLCPKCSKQLLLWEKELDKEKKLDKIIMRCIPFDRKSKDSPKYCLKSDKETFLRALEREPGDRNPLVAARETEIKARKEHAKMCRKWATKQVEARFEELDKIRDDRCIFIRSRLEDMGYAPEFEYLHRCTSDDFVEGTIIPPLFEVVNFDEHDEVKVAKPITERAWNNRVKGIMVEYMEKIRECQVANDRRVFLQTRKELAVQAWVKWLAEPTQRKRYPSGYFMPTVVDFVQNSGIQALIQEAGTRAFTVEDFNRYLRNFDQVIESWRKKKSRIMFDKVDEETREVCGFMAPQWRDYTSHPADDLRWMEMAVMVFTCNQNLSESHNTPLVVDDPTRASDFDQVTGNPVMMVTHMDPHHQHNEEYVFFPEFLHHSCCKFWTPALNERVYGYDKFYLVDRFRVRPSLTLRRTKWTSETMVFNEKASGMVRRVLEACGMPSTTKVKELDEVDPRLVCLKCTFGGRCDGERRIYVRSWRKAVEHAMKTHWGSSSVRFERISDEDAVAARQLEAAEHERRHTVPAPKALRTFRCLLCRDSRKEAGPMTRDALSNHIRDEHELDPVCLDDADGHFFAEGHWDMLPPPHPLTVQMVPKAGYPLPTRKRQ